MHVRFGCKDSLYADPSCVYDEVFHTREIVWMYPNFFLLKNKTPYKIQTETQSFLHHNQLKTGLRRIERIDEIYIQLSAMDVLAPTTMKNAAKCDT